MIVYTMTEESQCKELMSDLLDFLKYQDLNFDKKFRREVIHSSIFPVRRKYEWTSRRRNEWTVIYEARSRKEVGDMARTTNYATVNVSYGKYAYMITFTNGNPQFIFYPPHFFQRFCDRCNIGKSGKELYARFFRDNSSYCFEICDKYFKKDNGEEYMMQEVYGSTKDGVALGVMTIHGNVLFRTFVTYDMLKGDQVEKFTRNEEIRREIHEK